MPGFAARARATCLIAPVRNWETWNTTGMNNAWLIPAKGDLAFLYVVAMLISTEIESKSPPADLIEFWRPFDLW